MGRWMQEDPLGYVDGGNLYAAYMVMWGGVDPMGLESFTVYSGKDKGREYRSLAGDMRNAALRAWVGSTQLLKVPESNQFYFAVPVSKATKT